jgi:hypothetical protein
LEAICPADASTTSSLPHGPRRSLLGEAHYTETRIVKAMSITKLPVLALAYVALSRVRSRGDIFVTSPIHETQLRMGTGMREIASEEPERVTSPKKFKKCGGLSCPHEGRGSQPQQQRNAQVNIIAHYMMECLQNRICSYASLAARQTPARNTPQLRLP